MLLPSTLGSVLCCVSLELQETRETHDVINCALAHASKTPSDSLNIQCVLCLSRLRWLKLLMQMKSGTPLIAYYKLMLNNWRRAEQ